MLVCVAFFIEHVSLCQMKIFCFQFVSHFQSHHLDFDMPIKKTPDTVPWGGLLTWNYWIGETRKWDTNWVHKISVPLCHNIWQTMSNQVCENDIFLSIDMSSWLDYLPEFCIFLIDEVYLLIKFFIFLMTEASLQWHESTEMGKKFVGKTCELSKGTKFDS